MIGVVNAQAPGLAVRAKLSRQRFRSISFVTYFRVGELVAVNFEAEKTDRNQLSHHKIGAGIRDTGLTKASSSWA